MGVEIEAGRVHPEAAQLDVHVLAGGQPAHALLPLDEHLGAVARVAADAQRPADVVEHHHRVGEGVGEIEELLELRVQQPAVEAQPQRRQLREAAPERGIEQQAGRRVGAGGLDAVRMPGRAVAHALEAPAGHGDVRLERPARILAQAQVDVADDALAGAHRAVGARRAHRGDTVDELGLAERLHRLRTVLPVHHAAFDEHRRHEAVAVAAVGEQLGQHVAVGGAVPQVVVGIDDREIGLQHLLPHGADPLGPHRNEIVGGPCRSGAATHPCLPCVSASGARSGAGERRRPAPPRRAGLGPCRPIIGAGVKHCPLHSNQ